MRASKSAVRSAMLAMFNGNGGRPKFGKKESGPKWRGDDHEGSRMRAGISRALKVAPIVRVEYKRPAPLAVNIPRLLAAVGFRDRRPGTLSLNEGQRLAREQELGLNPRRHGFIRADYAAVM
jgi:hypothetical protein